jgi:two-component system sensor histidine kinase CiaH
MKLSTRKRMVLASVVYWFLLVYIVAALVLWFITLQNQNEYMTQLRLDDIMPDDPEYVSKYESILSEKKRNTVQYISEGITFLALILVGALFVYQAVRRQIRYQNQQENFMMAVTHELKTPLAISKLNLETLQKHHLDEQKKQKMLQMTLQEINRLDALANNILVSSQLDTGRYHSPKEELNFSDLVNNAVDSFRNRFPNRVWNSQVTPEIDIVGDALLLQILVNNLLENAVKYTPKEGKIECRLEKKNHQVVLQIADQGPGIPDHEKQKVFEKFYRIGNEATRTTKGTGLGLYLCKKIAASHHGNIRVTDNSPSGCNFIVTFHT